MPAAPSLCTARNSHRSLRTFGFLLPLFLLCVSSRMKAQSTDAGISRGLAMARAARLSDLHYALHFHVDATSSDLRAEETLTFADSGMGDLAIDFREGTLLSATLNGHAVATRLTQGHLLLPAQALQHGTNILRTSFLAHSGPAGQAVTRYADKDDGNTYVYTLFVPMDADKAFPCFDQPDLKARFSLSLELPGGWTAIGNTAAQPAVGGVTRFAETLPISTYLFAFAAGPFARVAPSAAGQPAVYVRKSQLARAQAEAPAVQEIAARGIEYLSAYFAQPFPFPKYDLVLIPGFPFGGMEHAGATFLNEDGVLFRSAPTQSDYFRRDILVLHETTHQWFGDLVTMRWFDDLWLKEGFAQYMAYKAMAALKPETQPWKHFYEDIKPLAYGIDETEGTTPIFQDIPNLADAKSAYGAIVYQKAPAVLKQLDFKLGNETFRNGLRLYLKQHAYANATWPDLIHAFTEAGGQGVQSWADAWILRRGMPEVTVEFTCTAGKLDHLTLSQKDILSDSFVWPISTQVYLASAAGGADEVLKVSFSTASLQVTEAVGRSCPRYVFANFGDQAYGRFLLDPASEQFVAGVLNDPPSSSTITPDPLLQTMLWGALWEDVQTARTAPIEYVELARHSLFLETDESLLRIQAARVAVSLHAYLGPKTKPMVLSRIEQTLLSRMSLTGPERGTLGIRIVAFRAFTSIAESPGGLGTLKDLLAGSAAVPGMPLRSLDRWNLISHLIQQHDPDAAALFTAEQAHDHSGEAQKYAYAASSGRPDADTKAQYFEQYLHSTTVQEDWITQSLGSFNAWNQSELTEPYLRRALNALPDIKRDRKIFFLGAWLNAFLGGQHTASAQAVVHAWLAQTGIDPDLRRKVLEVSDGLDRTVRIRTRYPE